jgi:hypothetical protein
MAISLSAREVTLLKRVSEGLLQQLRPDWLLTTPDLAADLQRLLSMDFIGTTRWNPRSGHYENAACTGRGPDMARVYVEEFQRCDPISPRLRPRRSPTPIYSVVNRAELERTRYFNEFLRVYQTTDGIDLHLYDGETNVGDFRFWRAPGGIPVLDLARWRCSHCCNRSCCARPGTCTIGPAQQQATAFRNSRAGKTRSSRLSPAARRTAPSPMISGSAIGPSGLIWIMFLRSSIYAIGRP